MIATIVGGYALLLTRSIDMQNQRSIFISALIGSRGKAGLSIQTLRARCFRNALCRYFISLALLQLSLVSNAATFDIGFLATLNQCTLRKPVNVSSTNQFELSRLIVDRPLISDIDHDEHIESLQFAGEVLNTTVHSSGDESQTPSIESSFPADASVNAEIDQPLRIKFTSPLLGNSISAGSVSLHGPQGMVDILVTLEEENYVLLITPTYDLSPGTFYTITFNGLQARNERQLGFFAIGFKTKVIERKQSINSPIDLRENSKTMIESRGTAPTMVTPIQHVERASNTQILRAKTPDKLSEPDDGEEWVPGVSQLTGGAWITHREKPTESKLASLNESPGRSLRGLVLRLNGKPLARVTLRIAGQTTVSDANGNFILTSLSGGVQTLIIDGATANRPDATYGYFESRVAIKDDGSTDLPWIIWMSKLDVSNVVEFDSPTTKETIINSPRLPGFEVRIPKGTIVRDRQGKVLTKLSITALPVDRTPFPIPEMGFSLYYTVQPGGAVFESTDGVQKPAQLVYPNYSRALPGTTAKFYLFDPFEKGWFVYGKGQVSGDGKSISGTSDVGLYQLTGGGAGFDGPDDPDDGPVPCVDCCRPRTDPLGAKQTGSGGWGSGDSPKKGPACSTGGDPVSLSTGAFLHTELDLIVSEIVPIQLSRTYSSSHFTSATNPLVGAFGKGIIDSFNMFFHGDVAGPTFLILPNGGKIQFNRTTPGSDYVVAEFIAVTPGEFYGSTIKFNNAADASVGRGWDLTMKDGGFYKFWPHGGLLHYYQDKFGNKTELTRANENAPVTRITGPSGRFIDYVYTNGVVTQTKDNIGRTFNYAYNGNGFLETVIDPLGGKRRYEYDVSGRMSKVFTPLSMTFYTPHNHGISWLRSTRCAYGYQ